MTEAPRIQQLTNALETPDGRQAILALFEFMERFGAAHYEESVTQLAHALQSGQLARRQGLDAAAITAALLHDVGHLLIDEETAQNELRGHDLLHEEAGAHLLSRFFPPSVTEPIRLHVIAKRYLCSTQAEYQARLSPASQRSYNLQGGRLGPEEIAKLENNPYFDTIIRLRRIDDQAKRTDVDMPNLLDFLDEVIAVFRT